MSILNRALFLPLWFREPMYVGASHAFDVSSAVAWSNSDLLPLGTRRRLMLFMSVLIGVSRRSSQPDWIDREFWSKSWWYLYPTWSNISASEFSSEGHNIEQALPTEWSNYLLIGGSHVSRTITLANPLDGNFNRFNWNRKTDRNADCPSSVWFSIESKYRSERFNSSMYRKLQTVSVMPLKCRWKIINWKTVIQRIKLEICQCYQNDNTERFRVRS